VSERQEMYLFVVVNSDGMADWSTVRPTEAEAIHARFAIPSLKRADQRFGFRVRRVHAELEGNDADPA